MQAAEGTRPVAIGARHLAQAYIQNYNCDIKLKGISLCFDE